MGEFLDRISLRPFRLLGQIREGGLHLTLFYLPVGEALAMFLQDFCGNFFGEG